MKKDNCIAVYGFHAVLAALDQSATNIQTFYYNPTREDARMRDCLARSAQLGLSSKALSDDQLTEMCGSSAHQGVVARVRLSIANTTLERFVDDLLQREKAPFFLILDGVTDPHNFGACLRVANAVGVDAVIAPRDHSAPLNATVFKTSSGAAFYTPTIFVTNLVRSIVMLKKKGLWIIGTAADAPQRVHEVTFTPPMAWVLGSEGTGLRRLTHENCDAMVSIPLLGQVESLNVSVSAAICLYQTRLHSASGPSAVDVS